MQVGVEKVKPEHLKRDAYLYVRQSTPRQVLENSESTKRQYALRQRAIALGWSSERIIVIDNDLGHSGASAVDREGFLQQHQTIPVTRGKGAGTLLQFRVLRFRLLQDGNIGVAAFFQRCNSGSVRQANAAD